MDFEAPNESEHAWLSSGRFVARRELNAAGKAMSLRVYDMSSAVVSPANAIVIAKPAGVALNLGVTAARMRTSSRARY